MKKLGLYSLAFGLVMLPHCGSGSGGGGRTEAPVIPEAGNKGVVINEICAANASTLICASDEPEYRNYAEWIELANLGNAAYDLSGCTLANSATFPATPTASNSWVIPSGTILQPGEKVLFWADGNNEYDHMSFKVKPLTAGTLALFPAGATSSTSYIHSVDYPPLGTDISYGLGTGANSSTWYYQATPSPLANNSGVMATSATRTSAPVFSVNPGFYPSTQTVTITAGTGASIRYTTDGSIPTLASTLYSGPVSLSSTKVLKARAFTTDTMPSLVTVGTYFIRETTTLPVVSVSTDPKNLFDARTGIYAKGTNAEIAPPYYKANFWYDLERPMHVEVFEANGNRILSAFGGLKINGNSTVGVPEKSLAFSAKAKYDGNTAFTTPTPNVLFPVDKPAVTSFPRFIVRNSGQDWAQTLFRDALTARVVKDWTNVDTSDTGIDYQAYRPVLHFINGEYWGVINLREKADEYWPRSNFGINNVDFLEYDGPDLVLGAGDTVHYDALIAYLKDPSHDIKSSAVYDYVKTQFDVEEFMNYVIVETFCGNYDWPSSNVKMWRPKTTGGKWRCLIQDFDFAWGYLSDQPYWANVNNYDVDIFHNLLDTDDIDWYNPLEGTFIFRTLIQNSTFRTRFRAKYLQHLDTTFETTRLVGLYNAIKTALDPEMTRQVARWGGQCDGLLDSVYNYPTTKAQWDTNAARVLNYIQHRNAEVRLQLDEHLPASGGVFP